MSTVCIHMHTDCGDYTKMHKDRILSSQCRYCAFFLGMSEGTGPVTTTTFTEFQLGSIGKSCKGMEVRIAVPDSTGEGEVNCESSFCWWSKLLCCG